MACIYLTPTCGLSVLGYRVLPWDRSPAENEDEVEQVWLRRDHARARADRLRLLGLSVIGIDLVLGLTRGRPM